MRKEEIKEMSQSSAVVFEVLRGGKKEKYEIITQNANIPEIGVVTAEELLQMPGVLEMLVKINSGIIKKLN
jgi:hypothetical protein